MIRVETFRYRNCVLDRQNDDTVRREVLLSLGLPENYDSMTPAQHASKPGCGASATKASGPTSPASTRPRTITSRQSPVCRSEPAPPGTAEGPRNVVDLCTPDDPQTQATGTGKGKKRLIFGG